MSSHVGARGQGLRQILRFNWPFYATAAAVIVPAPLIIPRLPWGSWTHAALYSAVALSAFWTIASLVVSWLVYDRSQVTKGDWIWPALGYEPRTWLNIHAGLDELTTPLRVRLPGSNGRVFDIYDPREMIEKSIARARTATGSRGSEPVDYRKLPVATRSMDAAFLLFSAHELRSHEARCALFREIRRVLAPGRRAIVAEHLRDGANAMAFGPGALHFHSRRAWTCSFEQSGFAIEREFSITPFVRVFVLTGAA